MANLINVQALSLHNRDNFILRTAKFTIKLTNVYFNITYLQTKLL